ncbi:MAG: STAS domain-containing protein [Spirochaetaceae bacterium]|jgi:SulP family sulfate permease|nr:STAS domain-containing protein [Spirochaetaceae bacterium]
MGEKFIPRILELFPGRGGEGYSWGAFGKDCLAGVIVGIVALPLSMAFSIAAGGTPTQGLYTAITAGFCISLLGGSKFQIGGPTGAFVVIIFGIIQEHGMMGLITATLLAGLMLVIMGVSGLGRFIKFIPYPVTTGFTTGIGVLIFSQQVKDFLGLDIAASSPAFFEKWAEYGRFFHTLDPLTLGIGVGTILLIILVRRFFPRIPGAALGVTVATVVCVFLRLPVETVGTRFGGIPASLPTPILPGMSWALIRAVLPDSFTIALLAAIESLLSAVVADSMTGDRHKANMELAAQGIGNMVSALFGGIPATGAIARTATNIKSGAVSPVAGVVHVLTLVVFILFLAPAASAIPLTSLSAVLMVVSWDMSNVGRFVRLVRRSPKSDAVVLITTGLLTIAFDLTFAVEVGVILAVFLFLRRMIEVTDIQMDNDDLIAELAFGDIGAGTAESIVALSHKDIEIYEITGPFFFGVADMLQKTLRKVAKTPQFLILRMRAVPVIDSTGIAALESFIVQCRRRKIEFLLCELREQPRKTLEKAGFIADLGSERIIPSLEEALALAESHLSRQEG